MAVMGSPRRCGCGSAALVTQMWVENTPSHVGPCMRLLPSAADADSAVSFRKEECVAMMLEQDRFALSQAGFGDLLSEACVPS